MAKLDETWDWGASAGTGQHRTVPLRRRLRFRSRRSEQTHREGEETAGPARRSARTLRLLFLSVLVGLAVAVVVLVKIHTSAPPQTVGSPDQQIPDGAIATDGTTDPLSVSVSPSASVSPTAAATATPSPPAVPQSPAPTGGKPAPTTHAVRSTPPPTTPARTTPPPPVFTPMAIQAEASGNSLVGGTQVRACAACDGGGRVAYIAGAAEVIMYPNLPTAGARTLTVTYESDGQRLLKIAANGQLIDQEWVTGTSWESPQTFTFVAQLPAGPVQITFYNDASPAPDLDKLVIS